MKRLSLGILALLGLSLVASMAEAGWGTKNYGGHQQGGWWSKKKKAAAYCPEEERWQQFWHDYYDALERYYDCLDNIDWVTYYKFHGYVTSGGGAAGGHGPYGGYCCQPATYAPVYVTPSIQWAVPTSHVNVPQGPGY
jgi:hypothetical protein